MAAAAECLNRTIELYKESYDSSTPVLTTYLLAQYQYWIQYIDCCGVIKRFRIDNQSGWETSVDPIYQITFPALFPPLIFVKKISDGTEIILPPFSSGQDGWVLNTDGSPSSPSCPTTTTSTTTGTPTTTKAPLGVVFKSCCDDATYSTALYPGLPKAICLKSPIDSVYILGSGTSSTLLGVASYSQFFLNDTVTNHGPSCSCNCATQSIDCLRIRVRSTEAGTFRYIECASGLAVDQELTPSNFSVVGMPTLLSVPSACTYSIGSATQTVNFTRTKGTVSPTNPGTNSSLITFNGTFDDLMSNSYYNVPVTGTYYVTSNIIGNLGTKGANATNAVVASLMKVSSGITSSLDTSLFQLVYSGNSQYSYTYSIGLGGRTYSLISGDKLFVQISRSSGSNFATYRSISCDIYPSLNAYVTQSTPYTQSFNRSSWAPYLPQLNPFIIKLSHPSGQPRWSGFTYSIPITTGYSSSAYITGEFELKFPGSFSDITPVNIQSFFLGVGLNKFIDSNINRIFSTLSWTDFPTTVDIGDQWKITRSFTFSINGMKKTYNQNDVLCLEMSSYFVERYRSANHNFTYSVKIDNGSWIKIDPDPFWLSSRNFTYFEVSGGPTHQDEALLHSFNFCARSPLQNSPPLQRLSGSYTYSVCQTPGSYYSYYSQCNPGLTFDCGDYTREFVEISGTQCIWPTTSTTTSSFITLTTTLPISGG